MILLIDNYDSFTYNLFQYLSELGVEVTVIRNDQISIEDVCQMKPEAIVLSPGPGRPENAGVCVDLIRVVGPETPILGICLGHQAIGYAFGAEIVKAKTIMHGKQSRLLHRRTTLLKNIPENVGVMRYHSLVIDKNTLPDDMEVLAESERDREIMAIKHKLYPLYGLQFHPESIGTNYGKQMLSNFLSEIRKGKFTYETIS